MEEKPTIIVRRIEKVAMAFQTSNSETWTIVNTACNVEIHSQFNRPQVSSPEKKNKITRENTTKY